MNRKDQNKIMRQKTSIKKRILQYLTVKGITKYEFYKTTGITRGILDQDNGITESNILKFIHSYPEVSIVWLIVGLGDMLEEESSLKGASKRPDIEQNLIQEPIALPLIPSEYLAPFLEKDQFTQNKDYPTQYVQNQFSDADFFTRVRDLSLFPQYNSGDFIACKIIESTDFIQWNKIYVLSTRQGVIVKRILEGKDETHFKMSSDNPSFHTFEISREEIKGMAIVRGGIHLE